MKKFFLFAFAAIMFACNPDNPKEATISVDPAVINAPVEGGEYTVQVKCENAWTATPGNSWLLVTPTEGVGDAEVKISVNPNKWAADDTTSVVFADSESVAEVTITRKGRGEGAISVFPTEINAPYMGGEFTLEVSAKTKWSVNCNELWVTYSPGVGSNNGTVNIVVYPGATSEGASAVLTISEYGTGNTDNKVEVTINREANVPNYISVSETKKVQFAPGNLQYLASDNIWRFAEHQYDYIGKDNENISTTYWKWIDLFCWGTGDDPIKYKYGGNYNTFTDWGVNPISNGGNEANQWRTLTKDEWIYLGETRPNAENLSGIGKVNGVNGFIFLADNGLLPVGITFEPTIREYTTNTYSATQWSWMEALGAVFLPAAGRRDPYSSGSNYIYEIQEEGAYWSSSSQKIDESDPRLSHAYFFKFGDAFLPDYKEDYECMYGMSVRLVKDVE